MIETYRFRLQPTKEQEVLLNKHFGSVRFIYNWALEFNQKRYASQQKYMNSIAMNCAGETVKLKEANPWLYEVNSQSLICAIGHLDKAFNNFFAGRAEFPRFKSKRLNKDSFEIPQHFQIDFKSSKIKLPKFSRKNGIKLSYQGVSKKGRLEQRQYRKIHLDSTMCHSLSMSKINQKRLLTRQRFQRTMHLALTLA